MSSKVDMFLLESGGTNFTEPRPPVPGEENEKESNGGMSTKSSGSHKSQVSHTSGRSIGDANPATPRKSNIPADKITNSSGTCTGLDEEMNAPLGFEPEGSVAASPPFTENSTPPYLKWAESLQNLLEDIEGVQLFRDFLEQENIGSASIDFWFACRGLKLTKRSVDATQQMIKIINKKFLKGDKLPFIDSNTKRTIAENINSEAYLTLFDEAQSQVEDYMKNDTFPLFLKSDLYIQYVSKEGDSPKSSNSSSGSNSASRPMSSGPLPTLKEDQELGNDDFAVPYSVYGPPQSKHHNRSAHCDAKRPEVLRVPYQQYHHRSTPYHVSYAPVSAQDSEIQSLSSQDTCLTDDTRSLTDSSVDGRSYRESRRHKKYSRFRLNRAPTEPLIPRTERAPKDRNIAETDCKKFSELLIEKLTRVQREREKEERMQLSLKTMSKNEMCDTTLDKTAMSTTSSKNNTTATSIVPLLTSFDEENADSILDEHCSRIWERSAAHTPSRSPGRSKSPDRFRKGLAHGQAHSGTSSMPGTLHVKSLHGSKKRTDLSHSMSSFDSGMGDDLNKCSVETHKHIHHHHHHHHDKVRKNKQKLEIQAQQHSMFCWGDGTPRHHSASAPRQKTSSRGVSSDACSNLDSGISMIESYGQPHQDISMQDPSKSKVLQWIMDNENMNRGTSSAYTDSDKTSSTHKRSHKSSALTPVPQQPYKQSGSKKAGSGSHMNRSASADSGHRVPWMPPVGVMPSQPIAQDPSMPMMPPPNTRVQLEEVNRRLNAADASNTIPVKSKSFTGGVSGKVDLDTSVETATCRKAKRSSGSGNTSGSSKADEISVGYFMCGDPIPYKTTIPQASVTLGQLKQHISKRGNFRYFVKTYTNDFDSEAVYEEIREDTRILPVYEGKILVKIERRDDLDKSNGSDKKYQL